MGDGTSLGMKHKAGIALHQCACVANARLLSPTESVFRVNQGPKLTSVCRSNRLLEGSEQILEFLIAAIPHGRNDPAAWGLRG